MRTKIALLILFASLATGWADDKIASVQQALKDQGFYYGEITGEKNADTTAAIRRYQIRNGLQITGELNDETARSIRAGASSSAASPPVTTRAPSPAPDTSNLRTEPEPETDTSSPMPGQRFVPPPQDRQRSQREMSDIDEERESLDDRERPNQPERVYPGAPVPVEGGSLAGTPYENTPPDVQRRVIIDAQRSLARRGLYHNEINGIYGPDLAFSLRAYQSRVGLPPTGRLDLETLAAMELLPGPPPGLRGPRRVLREPPVRGEWIRP
jgi:peptidoglycan hydrolase-like protein with peptidoglycan-binding domain